MRRPARAMKNKLEPASVNQIVGNADQSEETVAPAVVIIDGSSLSLEQVESVARGQAPVKLSEDPEVRWRIESSLRFRTALVSSGIPIYGVTTGVGDSADRQVAADRAAALQQNLVRKCGCGTGPCLPEDQTRAAVLIRANCLAKGYSGVRLLLIERLVDLLNLGITPLIPEQGSVGASGDLVPGSYIAAVLTGERSVLHQGCEISAAEAWSSAGKDPLVLEAKEGLAIINGTMVMAGIASLALLDAERLARVCDVATAMTCEALCAIDGPYAAFFGQLKPHAGLARSSAHLRHLLEGSQLVRPYEQVVGEPPPLGAAGSRRLPSRIQDNYSLRCAPHCIGALYDTVTWARQWLEIEINSTTDNPVFEVESERVHSGGNFSGFHVGLAMDSLKTAVASVADQTDRQLALLVDEKFSNGLPANLSPDLDDGHPERGIHHGFKGVQIASSALAAEAQQRAMPMTVFSRSTECNNQDKVSQATIAARQARDIVELTERCCAMHLLACCQAVELRGTELLGRTRKVYEKIRRISKFVDRDRELETDIKRAAELIRSGELLENLEQ